MKATLVKRRDNGWPVYSLRREDRRMIATTQWPFSEPSLMIAKNAGIELRKLSHENCEQIFGIYHPSELSKVLVEGERGAFEFGYCLAREHNRDKVFTLEQVHKLLRLVHTLPNRELEVYEDENNQLKIDDFISHNISQPTEIEVEIEMETINEGLDEKAQPQYANQPKLDGNGCMILRKIQ